MPSLITVNIALSMAVEQERQRQDGCAGLRAACFSLCPSASIFRLIEPKLSFFHNYVHKLYASTKCIKSIFFLLLKNVFTLFSRSYPAFYAYRDCERALNVM